MAAASSSSASAATRRRSLAPWLLLALWSRIAAALRRWFLRLVRRPLLRFGFGGAPRYRLKMDDADDDNGGVVGSAIGSSEDNWARVDGAAGRQLSSDELPLGLANLGNICFANAVVQCLRVVPGFVERLVAETARTRAEALEGGDDDARAKQWRVADALCDVLDGIAPDCANPQDDSEPADDKDGVLVGHSVVKERDPDARREQNVSMLRYFRQEASRCSYLVAAVSAEQEQQDAEEFLSFLLELLHDLFHCRDIVANDEQEREAERVGLLLTNSLRNYDPNDPASYTAAVTNLGALRWQRYLQQNSSMITDLFCGQTVRGSQCCSCASLTCLHEEQRVISLAVDPDKSHQSIAEALKRFGHSEQLTDDNRVFCDGFCQTKTSRLTQILLQRPPATLVLRLQRFRQVRAGSRLEKLDASVEFPCGPDERLDVTENAFLRDEEQRVLYQLVAVCAHLGGSIDSGHYISYVRGSGGDDKCSDASQQWIRIDDDFVSVIDQSIFRQETLSSAYLLFYARCRDGDLEAQHDSTSDRQR